MQLQKWNLNRNLFHNSSKTVSISLIIIKTKNVHFDYFNKFDVFFM